MAIFEYVRLPILTCCFSATWVYDPKEMLYTCGKCGAKREELFNKLIDLEYLENHLDELPVDVQELYLSKEWTIYKYGTISL